VKTPREAAHEHVEWACDLEREESSGAEEHSEQCDNLTADFAARDDEWNRNINANDRDWEARLAALRAADAARIATLEGALLRIESGEPWTDEATGLPVYDPQALARRCRATKPGTP